VVHCIYTTLFFLKMYNSIIFFIIILYWGYIVTFTKALTVYHSLIYPLHHSPLSHRLPPTSLHSRISFNRSHFSIFIHEYIIFLPYSASYTRSYILPPKFKVSIPKMKVMFLFPNNVLSNAQFTVILF
jgi:hypothetical protein